MFRECFFIHVHFVLKTYECPMGYRHVLEGVSQLAGVVTPKPAGAWLAFKGVLGSKGSFFGSNVVLWVVRQLTVWPEGIWK